MGYYERVFSRLDFRVWIFITPLIGILLIPAAMNIPLGIDFTGGTEIQILTEKTLTSQQITSALSQCSTLPIDSNVMELDGKTSIIVRTKEHNMTDECVSSALAPLGFSDEELGKIFPSTFQPELGKTLLGRFTSLSPSNPLVIAGILMSLVVFFVFRSPIPFIAVIQAAFFDILIALGLLSLFGFELNLAGVAALLMLIGYSIDTDIMLTSKLLKEGSGPIEKTVNHAFITGITMTGTTLAAMSAVFVATLFIQMDTITQIAAVILMGLSADLMTTWFTNLALLKWHIGRSKSTSHLFKFTIFRS